MSDDDRDSDRFDQLGEDLRFLADQRFKVVGVFLLTSGFLANVAVGIRSVVLATLGVSLSYLCWSWEERTTQVWALYFEAFKERAPAVYSCYPRKTRRGFVKATTAVRVLYILSILAWVAFGAHSYPYLWQKEPVVADLTPAKNQAP